jgi:hypothetical protein
MTRTDDDDAGKAGIEKWRRTQPATMRRERRI